METLRNFVFDILIDRSSFDTILEMTSLSLKNITVLAKNSELYGKIADVLIEKKPIK